MTPVSKAEQDARPEGSSLSPFRYPVLAVLWVATVVSNVGTWMQNAAAGWLMTSLDPDPLPDRTPGRLPETNESERKGERTCAQFAQAIR